VVAIGQTVVVSSGDVDVYSISPGSLHGDHVGEGNACNSTDGGELAVC